MTLRRNPKLTELGHCLGNVSQSKPSMKTLVTPQTLVHPMSTHAMRRVAAYGVSQRNMRAQDSLEK